MAFTTFYECATTKIPTIKISIPSILIVFTDSFRNKTDPTVVSKNTKVTKIGYTRERSFVERTLSQMRNEKPYKHRPMMMKGFRAALRTYAATFDFSSAKPPALVTPFLSKMFAVTLEQTVITSNARKLTCRSYHKIRLLSNLLGDPVSLRKKHGRNSQQKCKNANYSNFNCCTFNKCQNNIYREGN